MPRRLVVTDRMRRAAAGCPVLLRYSGVFWADLKKAIGGVRCQEKLRERAAPVIDDHTRRWLRVGRDPHSIHGWRVR